MQKKISLGTTILIVVLCCVVTVISTLMISFLVFLRVYDNQLLMYSQGNYNAALEDIDNEFIKKLVSRIAEVDALYRSTILVSLMRMR